MAKVLVIDDQESVRKTLQAVLKSAGHDVSTAADGRQGMQVVAKQPVDLVIVDIIMPEQDGLETIIQLGRSYPNIRIIAISGSNPLDHRAGGDSGRIVDYLATAKKFGAHALLRKPFKRLQLLDLVDSLLCQPDPSPKSAGR